MLLFALKMLVGDRAKYIGIILGLTFASFIITQQSAIFVGLMARTYSFITDTSQPDIWVVDPTVQYIDDIKPMKETLVYSVRGIEGVDWAVPLYKGLLSTKQTNGNFQTCNVIGIDDATLIGGPPIMVEGRLMDIRGDDGVIVDVYGAADKLASPRRPGEPQIPLKVGDTLEINDCRALVVGLCKVQRTFQSQPVIYTTYNRATTIAPTERKLLTFILAKAAPGVSPKEVCNRIILNTGLAAYTREEFIRLTINYYLKYTGIPINFGVAVLLGFIIGTAIAGQTFYNFTLDNLRYFGTFKAMGASNNLLIKMIFLQAVMVAGIGWGIGVGAASLFYFFSTNTQLSFLLPWELLLGSAFAILFISIASALLSVRKVIHLDPAIVFKS